MAHILIHNSHGKDDVERASLAFVVANTALSAGQQATVLLTIEGVRVGTRGYADGLQAKGFEPLSELIARFTSNGGQIWVCGACAKPRDITPDNLLKGADMVGAATAIEALVGGARALSW